MSTAPRSIVVGGGIAGLAAAHFLARDPGSDVLVLEAAARAGGKLRTEVVAGVTVDVGAEAMLNRRPEGVDLARELGLEIVHPTSAQSQIWTRGALRPLPRTLMGVPLDIEDLEASGVLSEDGLAAVRREPAVPTTVLDGDISVGDLVAARFGDEVVDRLVEPLLGGVYSGLARELSARAAVPMLLPLVARGSLLEQGAAIPRSYDTPMFACVPGGMGTLPAALVATGEFAVRTGAMVSALRAAPGGGFVAVVDGEEIVADRVVVAVPPTPAAAMLAELAPAAAAELSAVECASTVVVTLAFRAWQVPDLPGSGFLVPPLEGRKVKASTFSFAKWDWVREAGRGAGPGGEDLLILRTSLGRHRETATVGLSDHELVAVSRAELIDAVGLSAEPVGVHVQRWDDGLPQYAVGHVDRVARIRAAVAAVRGLAVCGAAYDGVGVPAVIASAALAVGSLSR